jgi:catechol 2,3-dioxygenase-like lactoylglutathione lyase family enzyme
MITRFDRLVIAVRDLEAASERFRALGFEARAGGEHPGQGTQNAIIRFGLDYLELLAVRDEAEARSGSLSGKALVEYLRRHEWGMAGYALATDDIERDATRLQSSGMPLVGPFAMSRRRPDGSTLAWQLLIPGETPWRKPWPFLIQWETPDAERLRVEQPGAHPNGVTGVLGVLVTTGDLATTTNFYERQLGLPRYPAPELESFGAVFSAGRTFVALGALADVAPSQQALETESDGVFSVTLAARDPEVTAAFLARRGFQLTREEEAPSPRYSLDLNGVRFVIAAPYSA